jgi:hypothetical protein
MEWISTPSGNLLFFLPHHSTEIQYKQLERIDLILV